jgi:hypothetical protein
MSWNHEEPFQKSLSRDGKDGFFRILFYCLHNCTQYIIHSRTESVERRPRTSIAQHCNIMGGVKWLNEAPIVRPCLLGMGLGALQYMAPMGLKASIMTAVMVRAFLFFLV